MIRRLPILSGLAILAVVINHAGGWGLVAMFWWTHRYRAVTVPNFDMLGSPTYYFFDGIHLLTVFAVQAFLFVSGFFIAYAARASSGPLPWKTVRARVIALLIPYLIWSVLVIAQDLVLEGPLTIGEIILRLVLLGANGGFFYIPVLIFFYLISPWIVNAARRNPRGLLLTAAVIMLLPALLRYARLLVDSQILALAIRWTPDQLAIRWALYFPLGVVAGVHGSAFSALVKRHRLLLMGITIASYIAYFIEVQLFYQNTADHWRPGPSSIFYHLYGLAFVLTFLAFEGMKIPAARWLAQLGGKSYGIYLTHFSFMMIAAKAIYHVLPWLLSQQFLLQPLLFAIGLLAPLIMMEVVARSPLRRFTPYIFG